MFLIYSRIILLWLRMHDATQVIHAASLACVGSPLAYEHLNSPLHGFIFSVVGTVVVMPNRFQRFPLNVFVCRALFNGTVRQPAQRLYWAHRDRRWRQVSKVVGTSFHGQFMLFLSTAQMLKFAHVFNTQFRLLRIRLGCLSFIDVQKFDCAASCCLLQSLAPPAEEWSSGWMIGY